MPALIQSRAAWMLVKQWAADTISFLDLEKELSAIGTYEYSEWSDVFKKVEIVSDPTEEQPTSAVDIVIEEARSRGILLCDKVLNVATTSLDATSEIPQSTNTLPHSLPKLNKVDSSSRRDGNSRYHAKRMEKLKSNEEEYERYKAKKRKAMVEYRARSKKAKMDGPDPGPLRLPAGPDDSNIDPVLREYEPAPCVLGSSRHSFPEAGPSSSRQDCADSHHESRLAPLSPPSSTPRESSGSSSPLCTRDLVSGVHGVQVPESAQTLAWPGSLTTVLPTLDHEGNNYLEYDASQVRRVASYPEATPESNLIDFLDKGSFDDGFDLVLAIRRSISHGRPVVVRSFEDTRAFTFTEDGLRRRFGISPSMRLDIHDAKRRVENFAHPQISGTMSQLIAGINDPAQCWFALDIPLTHCGIPKDICTLDDGLAVGWSQTLCDAPVEKAKVSPDNLLVRSWGLGHQAGIFTYPHHDADGDATYTIVMSGVKLWTLYFHCDPTLSRDDLYKIQYDFCDPDQSRDTNMCAETVYLYPGDLLIQPPAQIHSVYTPVASFAIGGHFYSYDTFHLTEMGRYLDFRCNGELTNQVHHHALETLARMVIGLPRLDPERQLNTRSLAALCLMVVHPQKYKLKEHSTGKNVTNLAYAQGIARRLLQEFGYPNLNAWKSYDTTKGSYLEPGDLFSNHSILSTWTIMNI